jgi:hypothetical protein
MSLPASTGINLTASLHWMASIPTVNWLSIACLGIELDDDIIQEFRVSD